MRLGRKKDPVPRIEKRRGLSPGGRFPPSSIHQVVIITGVTVSSDPPPHSTYPLRSSEPIGDLGSDDPLQFQMTSPPLLGLTVYNCASAKDMHRLIVCIDTTTPRINIKHENINK